MKAETPADIDAYLATFPKATQAILQQVREIIQKAAPEATEAISYAMPTFKLNGNLVHFAGYANHIGFYATPTGNSEFAEELSKYKTGKGSIQFPINELMPLDLITRIVKFRVEQNLLKGKKTKG
ncbi:iron chaperone [Mucilaginibacter terrae]|uniref:Uncharacterized protein YdhG (YjbR/CyaY superfamily) n=1 Tax=Mucilaginibacter terrae TaxID=1955052 RepID=A0ABU3GZK0_9SPHI|nr:DUF1801 domain-containing protein [Mucilaginibacter terrae]MDT3405195.1 uncharacterized protein YdhG (YjbR/CyaY superfamily) [Mucilaginibacter terrae]